MHKLGWEHPAGAADDPRAPYNESPFITCLNCESTMYAGDPCPECDHVDGDPGCSCPTCSDEDDEA